MWRTLHKGVGQSGAAEGDTMRGMRLSGKPTEELGMFEEQITYARTLCFVKPGILTASISWARVWSRKPPREEALAEAQTSAFREGTELCSL